MQIVKESCEQTGKRIVHFNRSEPGMDIFTCEMCGEEFPEPMDATP